MHLDFPKAAWGLLLAPTAPQNRFKRQGDRAWGGPFLLLTGLRPWAVWCSVAQGEVEGGGTFHLAEAGSKHGGE